MTTPKVHNVWFNQGMELLTDVIDVIRAAGDSTLHIIYSDSKKSPAAKKKADQFEVERGEMRTYQRNAVTTAEGRLKRVAAYYTELSPHNNPRRTLLSTLNLEVAVSEIERGAAFVKQLRECFHGIELARPVAVRNELVIVLEPAAEWIATVDEDVALPRVAVQVAVKKRRLANSAQVL